MSKTNHQEDKPPSLGPSADDDDPGGSMAHREGADKDKKKASFLKRARGKVARILKLNKTVSIEEEVAELIEEHDPEGTQVGSEERSILNNVLSLSESKVDGVMVPRTDIVAVDYKISLDDLRKIIIEKEHTRTPVYKDSLDNVIGFIHIKDLIPLFGSGKKFHVDKILREILYVPPSMKVVDLLVKMRVKRVHMALVLDEYGGTDGLVTMEDLVEEIVGEIEDEHDSEEEEEIKKVDGSTFEVSARVRVEDLEEKLGVDFQSDDEDEDFETVGGLIFFMLGRVPEKGEVLEHPSGYVFKIIDVDDRRVKRILVSRG